MQSLMWCGSFPNPSLKSFDIATGWNANEASVIKINAFLIAASIRAPHLESFTFECPLPYRAVGHRLSKLLASLGMLKFVRLDDAMLSSEAIETLAALPDLGEVRIPLAYNYNTVEEETGEPGIISPIPGDGAFPSIKVAEFKVPLGALKSFLESPFPAAQLQQLLIRTPRAESPAQIRAFFCVIATECPSINRVELSVHTNPNHDDFEPLPFSCRSLTVLAFSTPSVLGVQRYPRCRCAIELAADAETEPLRAYRIQAPECD